MARQEGTGLARRQQQPERPARPEHPGEEPAHRTVTVEQGRFCLARCSCGWRGPARRARSLARTDAEAHAREA
ncbi:hypothetical protein [Streptomyces mexicanus]|uniref:Uncharacterized protein n=1 Tax=Streptomyces mexicanus TaxID=178566 RepID=A0A7X1LRU2_9ACTN|nr:hypothetical protein [Streptomyces mexicanus]MBC2865721.1 hypothetical protein [Streptomyces mexicanus]